MVKEVTIVGGGFGGVRVAKLLSRWGHDVHITLIDREHYHSFYPDLYEVATANLSETFAHLPLEFYELRSTVAYPFDNIFLNDLNVTVIRDEVVNVNFAHNAVDLKSGNTHQYDILVLAVGSEANYFDIPGMFDAAFPLKNLWDALSIRNELDEVFGRVPKNKKISLVIGGGGFSGCEFAGELAFFVKKLSENHGRPHDMVSISIVEASPNLLGGASEWMQKHAKKRLESLNIHLMFNNPIQSVSGRNIVLKDGSSIEFDALIWTAGVRPNILTKTLAGPELQKNMCFVIDPFLRVLPYTNVFGVGDATYCIDAKTGKSLPMTAFVAINEAHTVSKNIQNIILKKQPQKHKVKHRGFVVPLGGKYALFEWGAFKMSGIIPWALKRLIALQYWSEIIGWRNAWKMWTKGTRIFLHND